MDVSRFFTLAELTRSETATRENIANQPAAAELDHLRALCSAVLDPLREAVARPIKVNSGYRSATLNRRIGGAGKSQHVEGKAADIQAPGLSVLELFKTVIRLELPFDQLIYEAASRTAKWVHVSHDPTRVRRQIMVAQFGPDGRAHAYPTISAQAALEMSEPATRSARPQVLTFIESADEPAAPASTERSVGGGASKPRTTKKTSKPTKLRGRRASAATERSAR